jgi:hypothetical protein
MQKSREAVVKYLLNALKIGLTFDLSNKIKQNQTL